MFLPLSCLRAVRGKLNYRRSSHSNYRAFCSIRRALNEKCATTRLGCLNGDCIFQKSLFSCLLSSKRMFRMFKKHDVQMARLMRNRFYSRGRKGEPSERNNYFYIVLIALLLYGLSTIMVTEIDWEEFVSDFLMKGEVEKIIILNDKTVEIIVRNDAVIPNRKHIIGRRYVLSVADIESFEEDLRDLENSLKIVASDRIPVSFTDSITQPIIHILLTLAVAYFMLRNVRGGNFNSVFQLKSAKYTLIDPFTGGTKGVKFSDVAGLKEAKQEIMEFVDYLKRPEHYQHLGAKVPKGALLLGPPGCGKTLLAKAVASEANVPFLSMNGSEFIEIIGGLGAARVRDLFSEAKNISPCIIYIDEIDAIGKKRGGTGAFDTSLTEAENTLNQLLVEMDGMASREGVITLASTNRADVLDKALLRPGRFDRQITIDLPTAEERREIFVQYLKRIRLEKAPEVYAKRMASLTPGFSGADIANVCNEAALYAARYKKKIVTGEELEYAVEKIVGGIEKRSSAIAAEEKHLVAYHEAGRALVGWLSEQGEIMLKMSIVPRTHESLGWTHFSQNEQYLFSQEELFNKMCMALGGRAAETLVFNKISTKSEKDLKKVTKIAYAQVHQFGMNERVGPISFGATKEFQRKPYSKQLAALMDEEARKLVSKAFQRADAILRENKNLLVKLAQELLKRETMTYSEVEALIGPPRNSKKKMVEPLVFELSIDVAAGSDSSLPTRE